MNLMWLAHVLGYFCEACLVGAMICGVIAAIIWYRGRDAH